MELLCLQPASLFQSSVISQRYVDLAFQNIQYGRRKGEKSQFSSILIEKRVENSIKRQKSNLVVCQDA